MNENLFLSIIISLSLIIFVVLIYIIYMSFKVHTLKRQINMHKDKKVYNKYVSMFILALSSNTRIFISLFLFVLMLVLVGYAIYLNERYNSLLKELISLMKE
jgi:hypothetical protein